MKTLEKLLVNIFSYVMLFIFIVMFFATLGIQIGPIIAGAGVIGLAVAFGAQGLVSDIVTGFFIILEQQLEIDDYVTTAGYGGIVEEIGLRTTKIRSFDGDRKSTRLNSSHVAISYAVFCLKKKSK